MPAEKSRIKEKRRKFRKGFREDLTRFPYVCKVGTGSSMVSRSPLSSEEYYYCCAYVLTDGNLIGLSHMIPDFEYPYYHDTEDLEFMLRQFPTKKIRGMPIGSKPESLEIMEKILQEYRITVTNRFEPTMLGYREGTCRHILVPTINEVQIYCEEYGRKVVQNF